MGPTSPAGGSREERRLRIEHTALELFRARGFDQVTVEDVCAVAGVAPATFYRHFGTKEEVVFAYGDAFKAAMGAALGAGAQVPERDRLRVVLLEFATFLESQQDLLALRDQIVLGHRSLMQRTLSLQREVEGVLALGLARLRDLDEPDATALLEAGMALLALRVGVRTWRAGQERSLPDAAHHALVRLRHLARDAAVEGPP
ncbi:TetR/AcrR family transcriptional regulator [Modestobacter sp. URMC 112]